MSDKSKDLQRRIQELFDDLVGRGFELGLQAAVYVDGALAADVVAGRMGPEDPRPIASDTVFTVCSTGKGILATLAHLLAERGVLAYERTIASYWPEFAAHGKGTITVRQALAHQSGLAQSPEFSSLAEMCDFDAACNRMAACVPAAPAGTTSVYHSRTFGWIVGGLIQRASGKSIPRLLREEITGPLGIADEMRFGIDEAVERRFAPFTPQPTSREQISTAASALVTAPSGVPEFALQLTQFTNLQQVRRSCMPAVSGVMSARAIARHYAALLGPVDGVRLFSSDRLDRATACQSPPGAAPLAFGHGWGMGYCLKGPAGDAGALFGHGGAGGSEGMANRRLGMAMGLAKNSVDTHAAAPGHTVRLLMNLIHDVLGHEGDGGFYVDR